MVIDTRTNKRARSASEPGTGRGRVDLQAVFLSPTATLRDAILCLERNSTGICLVVDEERRLSATITDGDIRRAILNGCDLDFGVSAFAHRAPSNPYQAPVTAPVEATQSDILRLMTRQTLRHIPLLDNMRRVVDLALMSDLVAQQTQAVTAVIMAGGLGTRLRPLTDTIPKPMLPLGDRPLLQRLVEQIRDAGVERIVISTFWRPEVIVDHFGDGDRFGVDITYLYEKELSGTAGSLRLLDKVDTPLLVINGDIVTKVDLRSLFGFHRENNAEFTVGSRQYEMCVPYGVIDSDGIDIQRLREKPKLQFFVNAGIYFMQPEVLQRIPSEGRFDMTDLIDQLIARQQKVVSFPIHEYWIDIGHHGDYDRAQADVQASYF